MDGDGGAFPHQHYIDWASDRPAASRAQKLILGTVVAHSSFKCKNPQPSSIVHYKAREPGLSRGPVQHITDLRKGIQRGRVSDGSGKRKREARKIQYAGLKKKEKKTLYSAR